VDPHGNAMTFWYAPETNMYARGFTGASKGTPTTYTRGGTLARIQYGERASDTYPNTPMRVVFNVGDRCSSTSAICDLPWDLSCTTGACANSTSPSFWTQKQLNSIDTQVWNGTAYANVDSYSLRHELKDTGSGSFPLTLDGITHFGSDGTTHLPEVTFGYQPLANRVDTTDLPPFQRNRLVSVDSESGSSITVTYSAAGCSAASKPVPASNTTWCFPQWWDGWQPPPAGQTKQPDWFTKYLTSDVSVRDATGASPPEVYHYDYQDGGAWHYDDDTGLVKDSFKTWAQWRGFDKVVTTKGVAGGTQTQTTQLFMRGMNNDRTATGGTKTVSVTDSQGTAVADNAGLQGSQRESITLSGAGGSEMAAQVDDMLDTQTAKSVHTWGTVTADMVNTAVSHSRTSLDGGRGVLQTEVDNTYDSAGLLTQSLDKGDVAHPTPQCTTYTYARNTSSYLLTHTSEVLTTATGCGGALPTDPHLIVSDERTSYDGQAWGAPPTAGDATTVQKLASPGPNPSYVTVATSTFDQYGRHLSTRDALNRTTSIAFTPASGNAVTQFTTKDPAGNVTTTTVNPGRNQATQVVDFNGKSTTLAYDPLGRLVSVWLPDQDPATANPYEKYSYTLSKTTANSVATSKLLPSGVGYTTTYQYYDGQLRPRQIQAPDMSGGNGRVITDTLYDSRGLVAETTNPYYNADAPAGGGLVTTASTGTGIDNTAIPGETVNQYDSDGRQTASIFEAYGVEQWRTTTGFGGDRTTDTPPGGAPATTTIDDARGRTAQMCQYTSKPASGTCDAASSTSTTYQYYDNGLMAGVTDPAGNQWSYDYDVRGRKISSTDPDAGKTTTGYDDADQVTSSTDARGQQISYVYDVLGHKTQLWSGAVGTGTELASWTYNTSGANTEQLATSTSFVGSNPYTTTVTGYDDQYRPTGMKVSIPTTEGLLGGDYAFGTTYNPDGSVASEVLPAAGGLPAETVTHTYDGVTGLPVKTPGYVQQSHYNEFGEPLQVAMGTSSSSQWTYSQYAYDISTKRLSESQVRRDAAPNSYDADIHYTYDPAGDVTSAADTPTSGVNDVQCFQYDPLRRLTQAWAQSDPACATTPNTSVLGGASPYWEQYSYDITGNRKTDTLTTGSGTVTTSQTYPAAGQARPHTLTGATATGPSGTTTSSYGYDPAGNTTTRTTGGVNQTLTWNPQGDLASVTDAAHNHNTSYTYDPSGNLLLQHDDSTATLYLPGEQLTLSGSTVTATRYYTHQGDIVAARTPTGLTWLLADPHGTDTISVNATTQAVNQRRFLPFGAQRTAPPTAWPGNKGFVGGTQDTTTGLTNLGAREYDPSTGRFLSADPIIDTNDPQQMNGYAYANNNPMTYSDPTGEMFVDPGGGGGRPVYHLAVYHRPVYHSVAVYFPWFWAPVVRPAPRPAPVRRPKPAASTPTASTPHRCTMGGRAGFEMGCTPQTSTPSSHGSGFNFMGLLKKAGNFIYHASGAADVVGCVTHPTWIGCGKAVFAIAATVAAGWGGGILASAAERFIAGRLGAVALRTIYDAGGGQTVRVTTWALGMRKVPLGAYLRALPYNQAGARVVKPVLMTAGAAVGAGPAIGRGMQAWWQSTSSISFSPPMPMCVRLC
jgi:RHS repeat-associated protein